MFWNMGITDIIIYTITTLVALSVHELAHGFISTKLGDPTPKLQGRLTLNPLAHLDPVGTILMIFTGFGWAKPVNINPMYYKDRVKGMALVALAGPMSNFLLAFLSAVLGVASSMFMLKTGVAMYTISRMMNVLNIFIIRNLCFMVFNLIPIPPLDGFKVLGVFIKRDLYYKILSVEQYIIYVLMLLSLTGVFSRTIGTGVNVVYNFIFGIISNILSIFA